MSVAEESKIFVGALSGITTAESMERYFSKFGKVVDSRVMKDKMTDLSRGFGFVTFADPACVNKALEARPHYLDNKEIDPKPCTPKDIQSQKKEAERLHVTTHKIFVGGLTQNMVEDELRQYFEKYGPVTEVVFAISKEDGKNRGFGFVTFKNSTTADEAIKIHYHLISGKQVEVKRAEPLNKTKPPNHPQQRPQPQAYARESYQNDQWSGSGYGYGGGMYEGYPPPGSQGGYTQNSGYGGYGSYQPYANYNYGGYGEQTGNNYSQMGSYGQQSNSSYNATSATRNSGGDSKSYHPYKR